MPTQQDLQRRKNTKTDPQVSASNRAAGNSASSKVLTKQSNMTSNPGASTLKHANNVLESNKQARTTNAVSFVKQSQLGNKNVNQVATQNTVAQAAAKSLANAKTQLAKIQRQVSSAQTLVNSLTATSPNSPQLAQAQASLAALQMKAQNATTAVTNAQAAVNANPVNQSTPSVNAANAQYTMRDILQRIKNNQDVSTSELAYVITKESNSLYAWMINNNPANVNQIMKYTLGVKTLPFAPDKKQMMAQIKLWLASKNTGALSMINQNFVYNPNANNWTTDPELVSYLKTQLNF